MGNSSSESYLLPWLHKVASSIRRSAEIIKAVLVRGQQIGFGKKWSEEEGLDCSSGQF